MPNPYFTNTIDLLPNTRARSADVEANLTAVEAGFDLVKTDIDAKAPLASPTFTGDPKVPNQGDADNDTSIANTAFVKRAIALAAALNLPSAVGQDGKFLSVVGGVPAWALARLAYTEETSAAASIANGQHLGLRNAAATTITGPASAATGDLFAISVENGRTDNAINWNGLKHMNISDATTVIDGGNVTLFCEYHGASFGWKIY